MINKGIVTESDTEKELQELKKNKVKKMEVTDDSSKCKKCSSKRK